MKRSLTLQSLENRTFKRQNKYENKIKMLKNKENNVAARYIFIWFFRLRTGCYVLKEEKLKYVLSREVPSIHCNEKEDRQGF